MQPGGGGRSFFQKIETRLIRALDTPELAVLDEDGSQALVKLVHHSDFGFRIDGHGGGGQAQALVTSLAFAPGPWDYERFAGLDLRDRVVLVLGSNMPRDFSTEALIRGAQAVLIIEEGTPAGQMRSDIHLADLEEDYARKPTLPVLAITAEAADQVLRAGGSSLDSLMQQVEELRLQRSGTGDVAKPPGGRGRWMATDLTVQARISVSLSEPEQVTLNNVLGYYPGQDVALNRELVMLSTHYDSLGVEPDGSATYEGADDSASALGIMLEIARLWHEQGYTPRRTVLFAAFTGAELSKSGAAYFTEGYAGPVGTLNPVAGFTLTMLGAGGDALEISDSPQRVADLLERNASSLGVSVTRGDPSNHSYQRVLRNDIPAIVVRRTDSDVDIREDVLDRLSADRLQEAGEAINLALIVVSRDASW